MRQIDPDSILKSGSVSVKVLDFRCTSQDRLFFNGYQTWTKSHEVKPSDNFPVIRTVFRALGYPFGTQKYGDEFFIDRSGRKGCFHGFSYMYRRRGDLYTLIASTDETNGYTVFYYDAAIGELRIVKDAGIGPGYDHALHIAIFEGTEDEVADPQSLWQAIPAGTTDTAI